MLQPQPLVNDDIEKHPCMHVGTTFDIFTQTPTVMPALANHSPRERMRFEVGTSRDSTL